MKQPATSSKISFSILVLFTMALAGCARYPISIQSLMEQLNNSPSREKNDSSLTASFDFFLGTAAASDIKTIRCISWKGREKTI